MTKAKKAKPTKEEQNAKRMHLFKDMPVWKALLKMAFPSMIMMFVMGMYFFSDNILSINFAQDSYTKYDQWLSTKDAVRIFMNGFGPINAVIIAFGLLFAMGISTRISINLGAGRYERAKNTLKTGFMVAMGIALLLVLVLMFSAKPWIKSQYSSYPPQLVDIIGDETFKYAWVIILLTPISMFMTIGSSLLRTEARNKEMMIVNILPIFFNLLLDWVFMGPAGMGIEGGAWATFISTTISAILAAVFIATGHSKVINFKNMIGFGFKIIAIVGIILVGIAPFLRNLAQSITQTAQMHVINDVSEHVYHNKFVHHYDNLYKEFTAWVQAGKDMKHLPTLIAGPTDGIAGKIPALHAMDHKAFAQIFENVNKGMHAQGLPPFNEQDILVKNSPASQQFAIAMVSSPEGWKNMLPTLVKTKSKTHMITLVTGAMPVFALFFPIMFSFAQAARPLASFNFGAKNYKRVRSTYLWTILYASVAAIMIYFIAAWAAAPLLLEWLGIESQYRESAQNILKVMMISMTVFGVGIAGMVLFSSTDRIWFSIISSSLRGFILVWPVMYGFQAIANHVGGGSEINEVTLWWFFPVLMFSTSTVVLCMSLGVLKHLDKPRPTLDERIDKVYQWQTKRIQARKAKLKAKYPEKYAKIEARRNARKANKKPKSIK